jgi:transposase
MISLSLVQRILLVNVRVDFRKGHDGLLGESYKLGLQPYDGDLVIFIGRHRDSVKLLLFDGNGLWVLYKKFQSGSLRRQFRFLSDPLVSKISLGEVGLLLEGTQHKVVG